MSSLNLGHSSTAARELFPAMASQPSGHLSNIDSKPLSALRVLLTECGLVLPSNESVAAYQAYWSLYQMGANVALLSPAYFDEITAMWKSSATEVKGNRQPGIQGTYKYQIIEDTIRQRMANGPSIYKSSQKPAAAVASPPSAAATSEPLFQAATGLKAPATLLVQQPQ